MRALEKSKEKTNDMLSNSDQTANNNSTGTVVSPPNGGPIRLNGIKGYSNRTNNIIYCPPLIKTSNNNKIDGPGAAIIYFGGDVQVSFLKIILPFHHFF